MVLVDIIVLLVICGIMGFSGVNFFSFLGLECCYK